MRQVLLQHPDAFRTTLAEELLVYAATGSVGARRAEPPTTLIQARRILRGVPQPRWSALIAAVVRE